MTYETRPIGKAILVRAVTVEKQGSLYLPNAKADASNSPRTSLVVVVAGKKCEESYEAGDILILSSGQATEVRGESDTDEKFYLVHETQVVGVKRKISQAQPLPGRTASETPSEESPL